MPMAADSIQDLITTQHRRIDSMVAEIVGAVSETEDLALVRASFGRMREALEGHLRDEDRLYESALAGARPPHRYVLQGFLDAHKVFQSRLAEIDADLAQISHAEAARELTGFVAIFEAHEAAEERLLGQLEAEAQLAALGS
jgi:Hemerythrin HHE cation binding domain